MKDASGIGTYIECVHVRGKRCATLIRRRCMNAIEDSDSLAQTVRGTRERFIETFYNFRRTAEHFPWITVDLFGG